MSWKYDLVPTKRYVLTRNAILALDHHYEQHTKCKATGLWYAWGREWIEFEQIHYLPDQDDRSLPPIYQVEVDTSNFITLTNDIEIHGFNERYRVDEDGTTIDWRAVSKQYDGIEVSPFIKECELYWYRALDIASGCCWQLDAIRKADKVIQ